MVDISIVSQQRTCSRHFLLYKSHTKLYNFINKCHHQYRYSLASVRPMGPSHNHFSTLPQKKKMQFNSVWSSIFGADIQLMRVYCWKIYHACVCRSVAIDQEIQIWQLMETMRAHGWYVWYIYIYMILIWVWGALLCLCVVLSDDSFCVCRIFYTHLCRIDSSNRRLGTFACRSVQNKFPEWNGRIYFYVSQKN